MRACALKQAQSCANRFKMSYSRDSRRTRARVQSFAVWEEGVPCSSAVPVERHGMWTCLDEQSYYLVPYDPAMLFILAKDWVLWHSLRQGQV